MAHTEECRGCSCENRCDFIRCTKEIEKEIRVKAIDECIRIIEETPWKDTDMLVEELKQLKGNEFFNFYSPVVNIDKKSYNKAIDEFAERLKNWKKQDEEYRSFNDVIDEIAKEMRGEN